MEDRIKQLITEEDASAGADTFAERADAYYRRRPRLMALLHDLYNEYVSLADRYTRALTKLNNHNNLMMHYASPPTLTSSFYLNDEGCLSDAESTLSYQPTTHVTPPSHPCYNNKAYNNSSSSSSSLQSAADGVGSGDVVTELVMKCVEFDFLQDDMEAAARESCRKVELQKSLLEVLESERLVLLGENSRLGYRAEVLAEEKKAAVAENAFLKRRAHQLARCVMSIQEDQRAAVLSRQIEDLQRQIYALERRNDKILFTPPPQLPPPLPVSVSQLGGGGRRNGKKWSWWSRLKKIGVGPCGLCSNPVHVVQLG